MFFRDAPLLQIGVEGTISKTRITAVMAFLEVLRAVKLTVCPKKEKKHKR